MPPARMLSGMSKVQKEEWIKGWRSAEYLWEPIRAYLFELREERLTKLIKASTSEREVQELRAELRFLDELLNVILPRQIDE